ncbi:expressed unknown protein [Seminavis robusta]|uniref:Uncharacterized protein n=1 Tax=Seminavis robusta TaxID=568900 RepID=A0A9N8D6L3_9STRA|nr:expressed unknown protein [Seminavis robusta]|eukprot:Sro19_g013670.1 n/a (593) ;mRNA; r:152605-154383
MMVLGASVRLGILILLASVWTSRANLRWASSGGGQRAMTANVGWAHAFSRAGLIDASTSSSLFSAVSTNSGGSWFSIQFFYSEQYFQKVVESPDSVYELTKTWMDSYLSYSQGAPTSIICGTLTFYGLIPGLKDLFSACNLFCSVNFDYAAYVEGMVKTAAMDYLDVTLVDRILNGENRVPTMSNTDLYIQTSLSPTAVSEKNKNQLVLIGPNDDPSRAYALFIPVQYSVKSSSTFYNYAVYDDELPFQVTRVKAPEKAKFKQWTPYHLYPGDGGMLFADFDSHLHDEEMHFGELEAEDLEDGGDVTGEGSYSKTGPMADFFGGATPKASQIMGATSATFARFSGTIPSFLMQWLSVQRNTYITGSIWEQIACLPVLNALANLLYSNSFTTNFSICSQWPEPCGKSDGRFADGGNTDGPSLAQNIGHYHTYDEADLSETLKVIVTNNNFFEDTNAKFLSYFSTTFNQGVTPGAYVWPPGTVPGDAAQENPWRSMQIFSDYLDDESLLAAFNTIPGTTLTTAVYEVTTLDNPVFGVKAGQRVQLLLLQINSDIPTAIFTASQITQNTVPLAELAKTIASSDELVSRIQAFMAL